MKKIKKSFGAWYFLLIVILIYIVIFFVKRNAIIPSLDFFLMIIKKILPVFLLIFILLFLLNYLINSNKIISFLSKGSKIKGWLIFVVGGILSTGPVYAWYPLLKDLKERGIRYGYLSAFLYNRSIKIALLPLFIYYFGIIFVIVLSLVMIAASILQGVILEKIMEVWKK